MKNSIRLISFLVILLLANGCICSGTGSGEQENIRSYSQTWEEIVNKGNLTLFDNRFSSTITYDNVSTHLEGIAAVKKYFSEYVTGFSNRDFKILEIYAKGDHVFKRWLFTGTHTGNFAGITATGKKITVEGMTIATMKEGKIVAERDYADDLGLMQQLGVVPAL